MLRKQISKGLAAPPTDNVPNVKKGPTDVLREYSEMLEQQLEDHKSDYKILEEQHGDLALKYDLL